MKHKWQRQSDQVVAGISHKIWLCSVCGCKKALGNYKFAEPDYNRNGQMYNHYVECIDYDLENSKTID